MLLDVLLVGDRKIVRDGMKALLSRWGEFRVVGEAENGPDAVRLCQRQHPNLVLMDDGLPGLNAVGTTQEILRSQGDCKIVILSTAEDENAVKGFLRAGVRGFILKSASEKDLTDALRLIADGGIYMSPQISEQFRRLIWENVSPHELEVLRKEIAKLLGPRC